MNEHISTMEELIKDKKNVDFMTIDQYKILIKNTGRKHIQTILKPSVDVDNVSIITENGQENYYVFRPSYLLCGLNNTLPIKFVVKLPKSKPVQHISTEVTQNIQKTTQNKIIHTQETFLASMKQDFENRKQNYFQWMTWIEWDYIEKTLTKNPDLLNILMETPSFMGIKDNNFVFGNIKKQAPTENAHTIRIPYNPIDLEPTEQDNKLTQEQQTELLATLKIYHKAQIRNNQYPEWTDVEQALKDNPKKMWGLYYITFVLKTRPCVIENTNKEFLFGESGGKKTWELKSGTTLASAHPDILQDDNFTEAEAIAKRYGLELMTEDQYKKYVPFNPILESYDDIFKTHNKNFALLHTYAKYHTPLTPISKDDYDYRSPTSDFCYIIKVPKSSKKITTEDSAKIPSPALLEKTEVPQFSTTPTQQKIDIVEQKKEDTKPEIKKKQELIDTWVSTLENYKKVYNSKKNSLWDKVRDKLGFYTARENKLYELVSKLEKIKQESENILSVETYNYLDQAWKNIQNDNNNIYKDPYNNSLDPSEHKNKLQGLEKISTPEKELA